MDVHRRRATSGGSSSLLVLTGGLALLAHFARVRSCAGFGTMPTRPVHPNNVGDRTVPPLPPAPRFTPADFVRYTDIRPLHGSMIGGPVVTDDRFLNCAFDHDNEICHWQALNGPLIWMQGKFKSRVDNALFERFTGERDTPSDWFIFAAEATGGRAASDRAVLQASIPCQAGEGTLALDAWGPTLAPRLQVCQVDAGSGQEVFCSAAVSPRGGNAHTFRVPERREPHLLQLRAFQFAQPDVVVVDNIRYTATICPNDPFSSTTTAAPDNGGATRKPSLSQCAALECTFNNGDTCLYDARGEGSVDGQWNVGSGRVGNPHTGIKLNNPEDDLAPTAGYAFVGRDDQPPESAVYVLESPAFDLTHAADLRFDYYTRSAGPTLEVCSDEVNCVFMGTLQRPKQFWKSEKVRVEPGNNKKIRFVARDVRRHNYVAVDNVQLDVPNLRQAGVPQADAGCLIAGERAAFRQARTQSVVQTGGNASRVHVFRPVNKRS